MIFMGSMGIARFWGLPLAVFVDVCLVPEGAIFLGFTTYVVGAGRPVPAGLPDLGRFGSFLALAAAVVLVLTRLSLLVLWGEPLFFFLASGLVILPFPFFPVTTGSVSCPSRPRHLPPP